MTTMISSILARVLAAVLLLSNEAAAAESRQLRGNAAFDNNVDENRHEQNNEQKHLISDDEEEAPDDMHRNLPSEAFCTIYPDTCIAFCQSFDSVPDLCLQLFPNLFTSEPTPAPTDTDQLPGTDEPQLVLECSTDPTNSFEITGDGSPEVFDVDLTVSNFPSNGAGLFLLVENPNVFGQIASPLQVIANGEIYEVTLDAPPNNNLDNGLGLPLPNPVPPPPTNGPRQGFLVLPPPFPSTVTVQLLTTNGAPWSMSFGCNRAGVAP